LPFGFTAPEKGMKERPLTYEDLILLYNSTPGFVSDKLKAVLEHVATILKPTKIKGIVFAYDEAQNLSAIMTQINIHYLLLWTFLPICKNANWAFNFF
jgi:hypothetical protein